MGGALYLASFADVRASGVRFECNEANTDAVVAKPDGEASLSVSEGGAIAAESSSELSLKRNVFISNAAVRGGAVHLEDPLSSDSTVRSDEIVASTESGAGIFKDCTFTANRGLQGASIYTATFATALSEAILLVSGNKFNHTLSASEAQAL